MPTLPAPPPPAAADRTLPGAAADPWWRRLARPFGRLVAWKALGTPLFMWVFFEGYFHVLRHPPRPPTPMPLTALDLALPFVPWAIVPYVSLWVYVCLAPSLIVRLRSLVVYAAWMALLCALGLAIFAAWPTSVPPLPIAADAAPGFALLRGLDAAGNACPSLHVATAVYSAAWLDVMLRDAGSPRALRLASAAWAAAIVASTLLVKQHVVWDVVGGLLLAAAVFALARRSGGIHGAAATGRAAIIDRTAPPVR